MTEKKWAIFYKKEKENLEEINENLMKHIENLEAENLKISTALNELQADNKEKELSLDEAHKIIVKLNEEYSKLMKEYKLLEQYSTDITEENKDCKKFLQEKTKKFDPLLDKLQKQNDKLISENEKLKKEFQEIKSNLATLQSENTKIEKESKEKNTIITNMKNGNSNLETLINEKENIIKQKEEKIEELITLCEKKDDELKLLIKLNQEYSHDTKISVDEITKQATNTIKMFYNNLNSDDLSSQSNKSSLTRSNSSTLLKDKKTDVKKNEQNDMNYLFTNHDLDNLMKGNKLESIITEGVNRNANLNTNNNLISENSNFKIDLVRTELFSSIFREMNISNFIDKNIFDLKSQINNITNQFDLKFIIQMHENLKLRNEEAETSFNNLKIKYFRLQKENKKLLEKISFLETNFDKLSTNMSNLTSNLTAKSNKIDTCFKQLSEKYNINSPNNNPEALMKLLDDISIKYLSLHKKNKQKINELNREIEHLKIKVKNMEETEKVIEAVISTSPKKNPKEMQEELEKNRVLIEELTEQTEKYRKTLSEIKIEMSKQKKNMKELQEKHEDIMIQNSDLKDDVSLKENKLKMYLEENEKSKNLNKNLTIEIEKLKNTQNSNLFELSSHNLLNSDRRNNTDYEKKHIEELSESNEKLGKTVNELKNEINKEKKSQKEMKEKIEEILMENKELREDLEIKEGKIKNYQENLEKLKSIVKNKANSIEKTGIISFCLQGERRNRSSNENLGNIIKDENENLKKENFELKRKLDKKEAEIEEKYANNNSNVILNSQHNSINESFNEKNYKSKKEEVNKMKEEINRLKDEIASLLRSSQSDREKPRNKQLNISQKGVNFTIPKQDLPGNTYKIFSSDSNVSSDLNNKNTETQGNNYLITTKKCHMCSHIIDQINDLKSNLKQSIFKDLRQFYLNYYSEIEKATVKLNEVTQKFSKAETDFNNENIDKKVKVSQVKDILGTSQKLLTLLTVFFGKYNKDIYFYTQNLKKVLDFSQKLVYSINLDNIILNPTNLNLELGSNSNFFKNKPYIITTVLKFFYEFTKIFNQTDLRKLYPFYENKSIPEIINFYKSQCESLKTNIIESRWDYETELSELDESLIVKPNLRRVSDLNMNNSYKIVNEKIMKLKKLEYDNSNFTEILKHYAIVQEIIVKCLYDPKTDIDESLDSAKLDKLKTKQDALEKVLSITEDTLFFKSSELDDDSIQIRRSIIKLLRNQKAILILSTELI